MAVLHRDFIKAIQSLVFDYCGIFGCAKVPRDVPFKSDTERQNLLCCVLNINHINCINSDLTYAKKDLWHQESPRLVGVSLTHWLKSVDHDKIYNFYYFYTPIGSWYHLDRLASTV